MILIRMRFICTNWQRGPRLRGLRRRLQSAATHDANGEQLRGGEPVPARHPALDHHVHRPPRLGQCMRISAGWYYDLRGYREDWAKMFHHKSWLALAAVAVIGLVTPASAREVVRYDGEGRPGTIVVKTAERQL